MILLAVASAAVLVASLAIVAQLKPRGALASLLAIGLFAWAMVTLTVGCAGLVLRDLSPTTLLLLALAWPAVVLLVARHRGHRITVLYGAIARAVAVPRGTVGWPPVAIAALFVAGSLAWRTVLAFRLPVVDILGWQYHLVFVDAWLQSNAIVRVTQNVWTDGWPATGELLTTWLAAFTRTDALTGFTALVPIPVAMVATSGLARFFGAGRRPALLAGLLLGMVPAIVALAGTTHVDTALVAAVTAAWWLGLRVLSGDRDASIALLFGIAAGLALGIKGTGLVLVTPILLAVVVALAREAIARGDDRHRRRALAHLAFILASVLVLAGSWYAKNLLIHGNPLFPVAIGPWGGLPPGSYGAPPMPAELAGLSRLDQVITSWAFDWQLGAYHYYVRPGGFGLAWFAVLGLSLVGLALLLRARQHAAAILVVGPALVALAALTSPWYSRYTLFVASLALALAARAIHAMGARARLATSGGLVALASVSLVLANISPNITLPLGTSPGFPEYATFVLGAPEAQRSNVDRRESCASLASIPPGARVAVETEFKAPHAAVGPNLDRILTEPTPDGLASVEALLAAMEARRAEWLVTHATGSAGGLAAASPDHFVLRARTCMRGMLWEFVARTEASSQTR